MASVIEIFGNRVRCYLVGTKPPPWVEVPEDEELGRGVPLGVARVTPSRQSFREWSKGQGTATGRPGSAASVSECADGRRVDV